MADTVHNQKTAREFFGRIKNAKLGRRRAFALGKVGNFPVLAVAGRNWSDAKNTLRKMACGPEKAPPGVMPKTAPHVMTSGYLYRSGTSLILQCEGGARQSANMEFKKYFNLFDLHPNWTNIDFKDLDPDDQGDPADESQDTEEEEEGTSDVQPDSADGSAGEPPGDTPSEPADANGTAATRAADAKVLTDHAIRMAPILRNQDDSSPEDLQQMFEAMLKRASPERLLLALCYSQNIANLQGAVEQAPKEPIERNDTGVAAIASALARMGARLGRDRGVVGGHEAADPNHLEATVRQAWDRKPRATAQQIIRELNTVLAPTFADIAPARLRSLLGLKGSRSSPTEERVQDNAPAPAYGEWSATRQNLVRVRGTWGENKSLAVAGIGELKSDSCVCTVTMRTRRLRWSRLCGGWMGRLRGSMASLMSSLGRYWTRTIRNASARGCKQPRQQCAEWRISLPKTRRWPTWTTTTTCLT